MYSINYFANNIPCVQQNYLVVYTTYTPDHSPAATSEYSAEWGIFPHSTLVVSPLLSTIYLPLAACEWSGVYAV